VAGWCPDCKNTVSLIRKGFIPEQLEEESLGIPVDLGSPGKQLLK